MKKILFLIAFLGMFINVFSQKDPEAEKILKDLSEKTKSHSVIEADFTIDFKNIKENIKNTSNGTIAMKDNMYLLKFMGSESYFDGKTLWNYIPEVNEVNITEPTPDEDDIFSNPKRLFTIYENDYKYQLVNKLTKDAINYSLIDLFPIDLEEDYSRIRLQINTNNYTISSATIFGKDGSHYTISLNSYKFDTMLRDSHFTFNEKDYKYIEIIDLRL
jgi:outer membrane lipoprotein-sorting protein